MNTAITWLFAGLVVLAIGACAARETFADPETPAARDAREQATEQAQGMARALRACTALHGAHAQIHELPGGHLVCRRGGPIA